MPVAWVSFTLLSLSLSLSLSEAGPAANASSNEEEYQPPINNDPNTTQNSHHGVVGESDVTSVGSLHVPYTYCDVSGG